MRKAFLLPLLLPVLVATPLAAQTDTGSAEHVGAVFCDNHGDINIGTRAPYLSPGLLESIAAAEAANQRLADAHPDEKPPLGDGIPWQSWPDYAEICTLGDPIYAGDEASLAITYTFPDYPDATYSDHLRFVLVDGQWLIDDIDYTHGAPSLREILAEIASETAE